MEDMNRQRPALLAQVQTLQKQVETLQTGARQRSDFVEQSEKRLSESYAKLAEMDARRASFEARAKELQDQIREQGKQAADGKREADRIVADLARLQEQSRTLEPQRKEVSRLLSLREQSERQLNEIEARLAEKRAELTRVQEEMKGREEQTKRLSVLPPSLTGDLGVQVKAETLGSDAKTILPKH
jgi:chromosome segregation ATPase